MYMLQGRDQTGLDAIQQWAAISPEDVRDWLWAMLRDEIRSPRSQGRSGLGHHAVSCIHNKRCRCGSHRYCHLLPATTGAGYRVTYHSLSTQQNKGAAALALLLDCLEAADTTKIETNVAGRSA
jgi:hypothetical protein